MRLYSRPVKDVVRDMVHGGALDRDGPLWPYFTSFSAPLAGSHDVYMLLSKVEEELFLEGLRDAKPNGSNGSNDQNRT